MTSKPNLFIVGAPKCGTSSMYEYLRPHPEVFMSPTKEPYYFVNDMHITDYWRRAKNEEQYLALFQDAGNAPVRGESSVWYLYSKTAAAEIQAFAPDAKIVIMLRNPVDLMFSLHGQFLKSMNETILDFEEAIEAIPDRRNGRRVPASAHFPAGLLYTDVVNFPDQVQRYYDVFGCDQVQVILFEDFKQNTPEAYRALLEFIGVDSTFQPEFQRHNAGQEKLPKNVAIKRLTKGHRAFGSLVRKVSSPAMRQRVGDMLVKVYKQKRRAMKINPVCREKLLEELRPQIDELSRLIDRDLRHWYDTPLDSDP